VVCLFVLVLGGCCVVSLERSSRRAGVHVVVFWSWSACALVRGSVCYCRLIVIRYHEFDYCSYNYNGYAS